jgi:predicted Zn-dependent protease
MLTAGGIVAKMFMQPFRPQEETQADQDGARWAFQLGYDPAELARVFSTLQERDRRRPNMVPSFLRSHPYHEDRFRAIARLAEMLKERQPTAQLYVGKENLKRRIPRSTRAFRE